MADVSSKLKKNWVLTREAFNHLLACLDSDRDLAAAQYEMLRYKLARFFEWRACQSPEDLADEAINIVARRIHEGETIENVMNYAYGVARMLYREARKKQAAEREAFADLGRSAQLNEEGEETKLLHDCLEKCLENLPPENRELILGYYHGAGQEKIDQRRTIAAKFNVTLNVLRINTCRIRAKLENCISNCLNTHGVDLK